MSQNGKRRKWSASDKLRIVLAGMQPGVEISDLCRREGLNPVLYYAWKKQLLDHAARAFDSGVGVEAEAASAREIERLHAKIGQLTIENDFFARRFGK